MILDVSETPDPAEAASISEALAAFNASEVGPSGRRGLAVFLRPSDGAPPQGGLLGYTAWNWLFTQNLWLAEACRGQGHAVRLLAAAEAEARRRGCHSAWIDTFSPLARRAYEKAGYAVFGELPHFVGERTRFFLWKRLGTADDQTGEASPTS